MSLSIAASAGATATAGSAPPPPPPLSSVEEGDVAAGRARVVEGQVYAIGDRSAPATAHWGDEPVGTPYRQTFDAVATRLGMRDPAVVGAEIDRQLYGTAPSAAPAAGEPEEGVGSFLEGAIKGDFADNGSWSATGGQIVGGLIPGVGQVADARDTVAAAGKIARGEAGGWAALGTSLIGWVPLVGDGAKAAIRGADKVADAGGDVARHADTAGEAGARRADAVPREQIVMDGGTKGDWPRELNARELRANADYHVNGYRYATDGKGRVTSVEGKLDLKTAERNGYQQGVSGREDRLPDDQGGHLIASIFNGPGDRLNLVPMNGNLNTGAWKTVENRMADALKDGKSVEARVEVVYGEAGARPDQFVITYQIDGGRPVKAEFDNVAGGRSDR